jgi:phosphatidylinositol alpha 1,6-mannosyltransferase
VSGIGVYVAQTTKLPLAVSWHTNLHEFGAMRLDKLLGWMGPEARKSIVDFSEANILNVVLAFYKMGDVLYAPHDELARMLAERTQKPVLLILMKRGIDTERSILRGEPFTTMCYGWGLWGALRRRRASGFCGNWR